jgi:VWFA-related protein
MQTRAFMSAALMTVAVSLAAQAPAQKPPDPQRPTFRTEANYVRVDAFPTRDGVPLRDLAAADFEILEDGVPQRIENFEFVQVTASLASERREPNTIAESREALRNPRSRVFVLFLDVPHVTMHGAWIVREPLIRLIDRILAPEDLVGIMTPMMSAADIVFARKTEVVAGGLRDRWPWGERHTLVEDAREHMYKACYPWAATADVVAEMVARRRERTTLDAMHELVGWLRNEREERKAILTISEGWWLYRRNTDLTRPRVVDPATGTMEPIPGPEPIGTGPDGRIRIGSPHAFGSEGMITKTECDRDRQYLSQIDNDRYLRDIIDEANRGNASFYTVDPRGLPVFDSPIGPAPPPPPHIDQQILSHRIDTLRVLADNTDGLAVVNSNDIEKGLRRMAEDLTSYYLLGYYSTNTKPDGRFRTITVRVRQPDVDMRARRGYKAATVRELTEARKASEAPAVPEHVATAHTAVASLARLRPGAGLRTRAVFAPGAEPALWVTGELAAAAPAATAADISATVGGATATARAALVPGQRSFIVRVPIDGAPAEGLDVRVRIAQGQGQPPLTDMVRVEPGSGMPQPVLYRRGPSTGNKVEPAGEPSFSRTERVRFDLPVAAATTVQSARLLDRNAAALELPVTLAERQDPSGQRWVSADVVLAALGPGDYLIEFTGTSGAATEKILTAFRVTR